MSTYNGEKYVEEQIESIIHQKEVNVHILIRDDGSQDNTVKRIQKIKQRYFNNIDFYQGNNLGYKKSFIDLIHKTPTSFKYYAFADQDDYWLSTKLKIAIDKLESEDSLYKLYASTVTICNEKLTPLYKKDISDYLPGFASTMTRVRLAGCTMVFNKPTLEIYKKIDFSKGYVKNLPSHDGFLMELVTAIGGQVAIDRNSYIYHRRLNNSVTGGGNGLKKRIKNEYQRIFKDKYESSTVAQILKYQIPAYIDESNIDFIDKVIKYRIHPLQTIPLCCNKSIDCGIKIANLETRFKILMRLF